MLKNLLELFQGHKFVVLDVPLLFEPAAVLLYLHKVISVLVKLLNLPPV